MSDSNTHISDNTNQAINEMPDKMSCSLSRSSDGSDTIFSNTFKENYHSLRGAILESEHVFINSALAYMIEQKSKERCDHSRQTHVNILEMGMGTALNAIMASLYVKNIVGSEGGICLYVNYETFEKYPLRDQEFLGLNYPNILQSKYPHISGISDLFYEFHRCEWNKEIKFGRNFTFRKNLCDILEYGFTKKYDVVFWDAFSPETQPELWSEELFRIIASAMNPGAVLTTYSSKGLVKRNLRAAGFIVTRLAGAGGKRHMLRATLEQKSE